MGFIAIASAFLYNDKKYIAPWRLVYYFLLQIPPQIVSPMPRRAYQSTVHGCNMHHSSSEIYCSNQQSNRLLPWGRLHGISPEKWKYIHVAQCYCILYHLTYGQDTFSIAPCAIFIISDLNTLCMLKALSLSTHSQLVT